jgi:hypothetical protein
MGVVVEEADESAYWIELLIEGRIIAQQRLASLLDETNQLVAIFSASLATARKPKGHRIDLTANDSMTQ